MTKWAVVAAAAAVPAVPAVRLLPMFAASPLPNPNPLPTEIAVPSAGPPDAHAHWDHASGLPDFPGVPVLVSKRDNVAFNKPGMRGYFEPPFNQSHFNWREFDFEAGPYLGFPRSHDVCGDGSIVCVPAPGHTPGSIIVFVALPNVTTKGLIL
jgi:hypothetical protein